MSGRRRRGSAFARRIMAAAALWAGILLGPLSCSEKSLPAAPDSHHIVIEGRVFGYAGPVKASVRAVSMSGGAGSLRQMYGTDTDASGSYRLLVPSGAYVLSAAIKEPENFSSGLYYTARGAVQNFGHRPDTLRVAAGDGPIQADFGLGRVDVHLRIPERYLAQELTLRVVDGRSLFGYVKTVTALEADTTISFPFCVPQTYKAEVSGPQPGDDHWLPGVPFPSQADSLLLTAGGWILFTWAGGSTATGISGEIHGSWEALGLRPPQLRLFDSDSMVVASAMADEQGKFDLDLLRPQRVRLQVEISVLGARTEYLFRPGVRRWFGGNTYAQAEVFDLQDGQRLSGVLISESGLLLRLEGPDLQPGYGAHVVVTDQSGSVVWVQNYTWMVTDVLYFPNLVPGFYHVQVSPTYSYHQTWRPQWFDRSATEEAALPLRITGPQQVVPVTFHLEPGGRIRGRVIVGPGYGGSDAVIYFTTAGNSALCGVVDPEGDRLSFVISGLADGGYKVCVSHRLAANQGDEGGFDHLPDFPPPGDAIWYPGTPDWNDAGVVTISGAAEADSIDISTP